MSWSRYVFSESTQMMPIMTPTSGKVNTTVFRIHTNNRGFMELPLRADTFVLVPWHAGITH
jgi:hypothetical protein